MKNKCCSLTHTWNFPKASLTSATKKTPASANYFISKHFLEKAMAPHSSTLAWKIPWVEDLVGCSPWGREESDTTERLPFHFHALEKKMATHSSVLAWRIPGTGEPGRLPSMGSHRVGHNWSDSAAAANIFRRNNINTTQPLPEKRRGGDISHFMSPRLL